MVKKWYLFLLGLLGTALRRTSVFGPLACLDVPSGPGAASTFYGKTPLPPESAGVPSIYYPSRLQSFAYQTSSN